MGTSASRANNVGEHENGDRRGSAGDRDRLELINGSVELEALEEGQVCLEADMGLKQQNT